MRVCGGGGGGVGVRQPVLCVVKRATVEGTSARQ